MRKLFLLIILFLYSCQLPDTSAEYQDRLVVFGNLNIIQMNDQFYLPDITPVKVSMSSAIDASLDDTNQLYINDALVTMEGYFNPTDSSDKTTIEFKYVQNSLGEYLPDNLEQYYLWPNKEYILSVTYNNGQKDFEINASTMIPELLQVKSIGDISWICEECSNPYIFGQTSCENQGYTWVIGEEIIDSININNFSTIFDDFGFDVFNFIENPENLDLYSDIIDEIELSRYGCRVGSFASLPYFIIDFNQSDTSAVRILSYALESDKLGLEPFDDDNQNGVRDANEKFFDYNLNELYDSTLINTFYDTTDVFQLWKGPYLRDNKNNPYLDNPFIWNINVTPSPIMWLYFNYYGKHLMMIQSSDDAYYDYFSGDPLGQNQYILPDSNIQGGYGLFSSTFSKPFFIDVKEAVE